MVIPTPRTTRSLESGRRITSIRRSSLTRPAQTTWSFVFSLLRAVEDAKGKLLSIPETARTKSQSDQVEFFRRRGSIFLLVAALASAIETYLSHAVADSFSLKFQENLSPKAGADLWRPIVESALPFANPIHAASRNSPAQAIGYGTLPARKGLSALRAQRTQHSPEALGQGSRPLANRPP